jgi:hypothetical protein
MKTLTDTNAGGGCPAAHCSARPSVDWDEVRATNDPRVVLRAMLEIWHPHDDAELSGRGTGEIDLILAARRVLARPPGNPVAWFHMDYGVLELSRIARPGWKPLFTEPNADVDASPPLTPQDHAQR